MQCVDYICIMITQDTTYMPISKEDFDKEWFSPLVNGVSLHEAMNQKGKLVAKRANLGYQEYRDGIKKGGKRLTDVYRLGKILSAAKEIHNEYIAQYAKSGV